MTVTVTPLNGSGQPLQSTCVEIADGASYESSYEEAADEIRFTESGTVSFGTDGEVGTLSFSPIGYGYLVPPADSLSGLTPGVASWSVTGGTGFFAGAAGTITSRFGVDLATNAIRDEHLALILLPEERTQ